GTTGTAGAGGTGGKGGATGAGGTTGTAGAGGKGGATGAGGTTGTAGKTGTDGGAPDGGETCAELKTEYAAAVAEGKMCNLALDRLTCQLQVNSTLGCPGCKVWVDDDKPAKAIQQKWDQAGCQSTIKLCPAILCVTPGKGVCKAPASDPTSTQGTCTSVVLTPVPL
ncbi:MAG TPA: hypothetical protein VHJ20_00070, partial [Polyangia bacterium]|nr:hypothetical protein [Polyangia bacterium]